MRVRARSPNESQLGLLLCARVKCFFLVRCRYATRSFHYCSPSAEELNEISFRFPFYIRVWFKNFIVSAGRIVISRYSIAHLSGMFMVCLFYARFRVNEVIIAIATHRPALRGWTTFRNGHTDRKPFVRRETRSRAVRVYDNQVIWFVVYLSLVFIFTPNWIWRSISNPLIRIVDVPTQRWIAEHFSFIDFRPNGPLLLAKCSTLYFFNQPLDLERLSTIQFT